MTVAEPIPSLSTLPLVISNGINSIFHVPGTTGYVPASSVKESIVAPSYTVTLVPDLSVVRAVPVLSQGIVCERLDSKTFKAEIPSTPLYNLTTVVSSKNPSEKHLILVTS